MRKVVHGDRKISYDLLRITAALMVVITHVCGARVDTVPPESAQWMTMNFYQSFVRSAVCLFFMLSGTFMLKNSIPIQTLYRKKVLPLFAVYVVWSCLYAVDTIGIQGLSKIDPSSFLKIILQSKFHLWFIPYLLGIYMLLPVLYAIVHFEDGKYTSYYLGLFFCWGIVRTTLLLIPFLTENMVLAIKKIPVELVSYCGYAILGYYLANRKKIQIKPAISFFCFSCTVLSAMVLRHLDSLRLGKSSSILLGYTTLPVFLEAFFLFVLFQNLDLRIFESPRFRTTIERFSAATMGIYLFHPFVYQHLDLKFGFNALSFDPILSVPVIAASTFLISLLVTLVMQKLPLVKNLW